MQAAQFTYVDTANPAKRTTVYYTMMMNASVYSLDSFIHFVNDYIYTTPTYDENDNFNAEHQTVEFVGSYIEVKYYKYDVETQNLLYQVVTTLESASY